MDSGKKQSTLGKRVYRDSVDERSPKRFYPLFNKEDNNSTVDKGFEFCVLLPNGTSVDLKIRGKGGEMTLQEFVICVKKEYLSRIRTLAPETQKRTIDWSSQSLHIVDAYENKITVKLNLEDFKANKCHILRLKDGSGEVDIFENMWNLIPSTDLLKELPEEYTYETALADLIDNSLQAVWSNKHGERRLISVKITEQKIEIFDTGPGMDGSHENSLVQWGKMGASSNRSVKEQAIGCKPPFLMPYFGLYGYGGLIASMHLGRRGLVSSKTRQSKKVSMLQLDREALLRASTEQSWRAGGGFRNPLKSEIERAPHGSFTKVEVFEPSCQIMDIFRLQCALKDIYFPYIQNNEVSKTGRTTMPIEFVVNGANLAEVTGGEVAVTNLLSCNGQEFTLQLHFSQDVSSTPHLGLRASVDAANARLKCVYFPIIGGKESIDRILETLKENGCGISEDFTSFSHVSIRRLGRLLPDARWAWLPFMEPPKQRKGVRGLNMKRCCFRVKCFIDTDGGFNPTASKTDLAHHHPYTTALKNFGSKTLDKDVHIKIIKDGKELKLAQLEKQYIDWISQMHDAYDEEAGSGEDEPIFIVDPSNKNELGISSDVIRVHKRFFRKGNSWISGQKVKVLKGACAGYHKTNTYAILEYIILENWKGDSGGEARLICRPMGIPNDCGCALHIDDENVSIEIGKSISLPVSVIDTGKFVAVEDAEWQNQTEKSRQKAPSSIDMLNAMHCLNLGIEGEVLGGVIDAGFVPPKEIVAVIRPACFKPAMASRPIDQRDIFQEDAEMTIEIIYRDDNMNSKTIFSHKIRPSSRRGFHGLYILPLRAELPKLFWKAGHYTFSFSLEELSCRKFEKKVHVKALPQVGKWKLLSDPKINRTRVGSCFPPVLVACYDRYSNRIPFSCNTEVKIKISSGSAGFNAQLTGMKQSLSSDYLRLRVEDVMVESCTLDKIRPSYEAKFSLFSKVESFSIETPCQVFPGAPEIVSIKPVLLGKELIPGQVIRDLKLEVSDAYNNHVREHETISLEVDGFCILKRGSDFKVDRNGWVDLGGLLKVTEGYGKSVSFSVLSEGRVIFEQVLQTERRILRAAFEQPISCAAGTQLENLIFEVINTEGDVEVNIHNEDKGGQSHTLTVQSDSLQIDDSVRYSFSYGCCKVRSIPVPVTEGIFYFEVAHSFHPELHLSIEVHVERAPKQEHECLPVPAESLERNISPFPGFSGLSPSEMKSVDFRNQTSDERLDLPDLSLTSNVQSLVLSIIKDQTFLEENLCIYGVRIKDLEDSIKLLEHEQNVTTKEICNLQASLDLDNSHDQGCTSEKDWVMGQIARKSGTAAAVFCRMFQSLNNKPLKQQIDFMDKILGVVACLGIVHTDKLSRILARFLGEDRMLAIVCESSSYASSLLKYGPDGHVNVACGLHALAANLGLTLDRHFVVICLENIRPYAGEIRDDSRRILCLPKPTLSNGKPPPGFLGFAVNMIDPDVNHWSWKTSSGHGLRETLFYRLFGDLQVYESREDMNKANSFITGGAVSLDGGIIINGIFPMGHCEPDIQFPVVCSHTGKHLSEQNVGIMKQIEEKQQKLRVLANKLKIKQKDRSKVMKKYTKKRDRYQKFLVEKGPFLCLSNSTGLSQQ